MNTMNFYFDSLEEFLHMNGHGPYVWFCYIVTVVVFAVLIALPVIKKRQFFKQQRIILRRNTHERASRSESDSARSSE